MNLKQFFTRHLLIGRFYVDLVLGEMRHSAAAALFAVKAFFERESQLFGQSGDQELQSPLLLAQVLETPFVMKPSKVQGRQVLYHSLHEHLQIAAALKPTPAPPADRFLVGSSHSRPVYFT